MRESLAGLYNARYLPPPPFLSLPLFVHRVGPSIRSASYFTYQKVLQPLHNNGGHYSGRTALPELAYQIQ
jgi:hypothetical protein